MVVLYNLSAMTAILLGVFGILSGYEEESATNFTNFH